MVQSWSAVVGLLVVGTGAVLTSASYLPASEGGPIGVPDVLLREMVARMGSGLAHPPDNTFLTPLSQRRLEEEAEEEAEVAAAEEEVGMKKLRESSLPLEYDELSLSPSLRDQEYLAHSTLLGSVLGNYAEEKMKQHHAKPSQGGGSKDGGSTDTSDGDSTSGTSSGSSSSSSTTTTSTDGVLPAYCNPPNPCPLGYTARDGCLEVFENTATFSRDYQALQDCMCDTEHMFECDDSTQDSEITALARSIQNEGMLDSTLDKIMSGLAEQNGHPLVAKKFHQKKNTNPYLQGEKLPVAAKKGGMM